MAQKAFKEGGEGVEDERRSGCPSSSKTEQNVDAVRSVVTVTKDSLSERGIAKSIVHEIVTQDLTMREVYAKRVAKNLSPYQKEHRQLVCQDLLACLEREPDFFESGEHRR